MEKFYKYLRKYWPDIEATKEILVRSNKNKNEHIINKFSSLYEPIPVFENCEDCHTQERAVGSHVATELNNEEIDYITKVTGVFNTMTIQSLMQIVMLTFNIMLRM